MAEPVKVVFDDKQVMAWLSRLKGKMSKLGIILDKASQIMRNDVIKHFDTDKQDSSGKPWKPSKSPFTKGGTLERGGDLKGSINARYSNSNAEVYTNKIYAAIHNYGGVITPKPGGAKALYIPLTKQGMRKAGEKKSPEGSVYGKDWIFAQKSTIPRREFMWISDDALSRIEQTFLNEIAD